MAYINSTDRNNTIKVLTESQENPQSSETINTITCITNSNNQPEIQNCDPINKAIFSDGILPTSSRGKYFT